MPNCTEKATSPFVEYGSSVLEAMEASGYTRAALARKIVDIMGTGTVDTHTNNVRHLIAGECYKNGTPRCPKDVVEIVGQILKPKVACPVELLERRPREALNHFRTQTEEIKAFGLLLASKIREMGISYATAARRVGLPDATAITNLRKGKPCSFETARAYCRLVGLDDSEIPAAIRIRHRPNFKNERKGRTTTETYAVRRLHDPKILLTVIEEMLQEDGSLGRRIVNLIDNQPLTIKGELRGLESLLEPAILQLASEMDGRNRTTVGDYLAKLFRRAIVDLEFLTRLVDANSPTEQEQLLRERVAKNGNGNHKKPTP